MERPCRLQLETRHFNDKKVVQWGFFFTVTSGQHSLAQWGTDIAPNKDTLPAPVEDGSDQADCRTFSIGYRSPRMIGLSTYQLASSSSPIIVAPLSTGASEVRMVDRDPRTDHNPFCRVQFIVPGGSDTRCDTNFGEERRLCRQHLSFFLVNNGDPCSKLVQEGVRRLSRFFPFRQPSPQPRRDREARTTAKKN